MKTLYRQRRELLQRHLDPAVAIDRFAGLTAIALLPYGTDDVALARRAIAREIAPAPLSLWSAEPTRARPGLILGITTLSESGRASCWERVCQYVSISVVAVSLKKKKKNERAHS